MTPAPGRFMCGCPISPEVPWASSSACPDGHNICPTHGRHEYGWRSIPFKMAKIAKHPDNPNAKDEFKSVPDHGRTGEFMGFGPFHDLPDKSEVERIEQAVRDELAEMLEADGATVV